MHARQSLTLHTCMIYMNFLEALREEFLSSKSDMIEKGFEYAYMYGEPRNADSKRYRVIPKCCKVWGRSLCGSQCRLSNMTTG